MPLERQVKGHHYTEEGKQNEFASGVWRLASGVWRLASKANWISADKGFITYRVLVKKRAWSEPKAQV